MKTMDELLSDLDALHALKKSAPAGDEPPADEDEDKDDEAIAAAAGDGDGDEGLGGDGDGDGDEEPMGKSLVLTLEDGQTIEAVDGTELVKSLQDRMESAEEAMTKALGSAIDLIKSQGAQIESLQSRVEKLASEGRGRKAVVSVAEKVETPLQKSEPAGVSGDEFMAKALAAQSAGKISAHLVAVAEASLLKGLPVPADIVNRVLN